MQFFGARPWRKCLLVALLLFLLTRALTLTAFPIFNDEAIYLQYAQLIHDNWEKNKYISMDGDYHDWKPPLQYWLAAPVINRGNDPLIAGRLVALLVSLAGFFGFYLFAKELFSEREGAIAGVLYAFCPPVAFHNVEFIAETFLFSTAPFVYWALLKTMRPQASRWAWVAVAIACATALLLFKQSGLLLLGLSICLPFARLQAPFRWRDFALNAGIVIAVILAAHLLITAILPAEFNETKEQFDSKWVMPARELISLPWDSWNSNLHLISNYIGANYSWLVPAFFGAFLWLACRRKAMAELALALMCCGGAIATCLLLRGFNEYIFNTAIIVALLPFLARGGVFGFDSANTVLRRGTIALAGAMLIFWAYQITLMWASPGRYVERSTPWAAANYLDAWPTGFGVKEVVAMLEKEKRPGLILADAQWGNPRTALEVYAKRFPHLQIVPISREFSDPAAIAESVAAAIKAGPARFAIFSADASGQRAAWQERVQRDFCTEQTEIKAYPAQMPIVVCRF